MTYQFPTRPPTIDYSAFLQDDQPSVQIRSTLMNGTDCKSVPIGIEYKFIHLLKTQYRFHSIGTRTASIVFTFQTSFRATKHFIDWP